MREQPVEARCLRGEAARGGGVDGADAVEGAGFVAAEQGLRGNGDDDGGGDAVEDTELGLLA